MVKDLQDAQMGDQNRLAYIMKRIEDGRSIYNSDEQYVRYKFGQLRKEITSESKDESEHPDTSENAVTSSQPDRSDDAVASPPPDPQPAVAPKTVNDSHPSKAWYILPVFLGILGGLIAYAKLRKRNRGMSYKTLGLGVGLTVLLFVPLVAVDFFDAKPAEQHIDEEPDSKSIVERTDKEVKKQAIHVPYDALMEQSDMHVGETVWYEGKLVEVKKQLSDKYILRVKIAQGEDFLDFDAIRLNYTPTSDEERAWLDKIESEHSNFEFNDETVKFWGILKGLIEYRAVIGPVTVPEVDVIILERVQNTSKNDPNYVDPEPQITTSDQPYTSHTVSFSDIPTYVDGPTVERAVIDVLREWDISNPNMGFTIVESDADVNINWARYMLGSALGLHSASVTDDGTRESHSITVRLGIDDCHSTYQPFTHETLQYTIAHEIGHYLGLRHIDDESHLMYSGGFFNVDAARVYGDLNLSIPHLEPPDVATTSGLVIQSQIDALNLELEEVSMQRQELKNVGEVLDDNTDIHNDLVQKIQELEDQLACVNLT